MASATRTKPQGYSVRFRVGILAALFSAMVFFAADALALDARLRISQYKHTRWTAADGAPLLILSIAQGEDGFLWIGSSAGLHRFDGIAFDPIQPPSQEAEAWRVSALLASRDGTIWVGYDSGNLAAYADGVLRDASTPLSNAYVMKLLQTKDGTIWAVLGRPNRALLRYANGAWQEVGSDWQLPAEWLIDAIATADGALWVTTLESILVLRQGQRHFERIGATKGHAALSEDKLGRVWLSDDTGSRPIAPIGEADAWPTPAAERNMRGLFDRDGNLWAVIGGRGVFRLRPAANSSSTERVERYTAKDGLTSDSASDIIEDREGNIWVATSLGLDRFRNVNVVAEPTLTNAPMYGFRVLGASDGSVYVGSGDAIHRALPSEAIRPLVDGITQTDALCEGPDGSVWAFLRDRVLRIRGDAITTVSLPDHQSSGISENGTGTHDCAVDRGGVLWANMGRQGLFSRVDGTWKHHRPEREDAWAETMITDRNRNLVLDLRSNEVVRAGADGQPAEWLFKQDSRTSMMFQGRNALYLGSGHGTTRLMPGRASHLRSSRFPWLHSPTGMVETELGQIWLIGRAGIVAVDARDFDRAFDDPGFNLKATVFDFEDGLPNMNYLSGKNDATRGGDGRLWFAVSGGVVWVDPSNLHRNPSPPPVAIRGITADGVSYSPSSGVTLPKGSRTVEIAYSGLSLSIPQRVKYKYRLVEASTDWIEAGSRREVSFTDLDPGTYTFQVIAANNDGIWSTEGQTLAFSIEPTFLQSIWFKFICAFLLGLCIWLAYAFRVRQLTEELQRRFEVRTAERERIARELHDTLLQGVQGLMLRFQSVANRIPAADPMRTFVDDALDRAEEVVIEGRRRVRDLRSDANGDFPDILVSSASEVVGADGPQVQYTVEGRPRTLHPIVQEEALRVANEAIRNAVIHADARTIHLLLTYGYRSLRLSIRDDGAGMPVSVLVHGARAGHYGLVGMRERAHRIGGRLEVASRERAGTEVTLTVPSRAAYRERSTGLIERAKKMLGHRT